VRIARKSEIVNPKSEIMNDFSEPTHAVEHQQVKCKDCGAMLKFEPGKMSMACEYCGANNEIAHEAQPAPVEEIDFESFISEQVSSAEKMEVSVVKCDSCGASSSLKPNVTSDACPFCGTPLVLKSGSTCSIIKPKYVLPFAVDKKSAFGEFKKWLKSLWFAPNDLKKFAENEKLNGIYIPYWTYDSSTTSHYTGARGDHYYVTETYTVNGQTQTRQVQKTRWTPVSGTVFEAFDDVLVVASESLPVKYVNDLEPWDLSNLAAFSEQFLSGFRSEQYQLDVKAGFEKAKDRMEKVIRESCRQHIGGDVQRIATLDTQHANVTFKHILLPIWLSAYRYKSKVYRFMINGRTGEVQGERPYSFWKIFFTITGVLAVIGGGIYLWYLYDQGKL